MSLKKCIQAISQSYRRGFACEDRAKAEITRLDTLEYRLGKI
ncbi:MULTISPECIES: hypothetical protein [unclassified Lentimonas]|nr:MULTISPECIES: hypothetical protein [unclassified Lentimonas]CAA6691581.1 Unannotated [Lentimonas sp. CC19]CAA6692222.1 Unannotated [Lentimonas sp. CC10]CAA7070164.1 Unannotated [Lentimonas sp. CC11]